MTKAGRICCLLTTLISVNQRSKVREIKYSSLNDLGKMVWIFFKSVGTKRHYPLIPCWAPLVFVIININGMIWETNINSIGQSLSNSMNLWQSSILLCCACYGVLFFIVALWQLLHIQSDLPVVYLLSMSVWYFVSFNLITFFRNSRITIIKIIMQNFFPLFSRIFLTVLFHYHQGYCAFLFFFFLLLSSFFKCSFFHNQD